MDHRGRRCDYLLRVRRQLTFLVAVIADKGISRCVATLVGVKVKCWGKPTAFEADPARGRYFFFAENTSHRGLLVSTRALMPIDILGIGLALRRCSCASAECCLQTVGHCPCFRHHPYTLAVVKKTVGANKGMRVGMGVVIWQLVVLTVEAKVQTPDESLVYANCAKKS